MRIHLVVDIHFDTECDGEFHGESVVNRELVAEALLDSLDVNLLADAVTEETGWSIYGLAVSEG